MLTYHNIIIIFSYCVHIIILLSFHSTVGHCFQRFSVWDIIFDPFLPEILFFIAFANIIFDRFAIKNLNFYPLHVTSFLAIYTQYIIFDSFRFGKPFSTVSFSDIIFNSFHGTVPFHPIMLFSTIFTILPHIIADPLCPVMLFSIYFYRTRTRTRTRAESLNNE